MELIGTVGRRSKELTLADEAAVAATAEALRTVQPQPVSPAPRARTEAELRAEEDLLLLTSERLPNGKTVTWG